MKKVILDTDIGGDPDDLMALLFLLEQKNIDIELIITNDEHKGHRKLYTEKLLSTIGKKIKVVEGIDLGNEKCCVICDLIKNNRGKKFRQLTFTKEIGDIVKNNKITEYLCIGPQSNLSKFLEEYPELANKINITIMGCRFNDLGRAEHNIKYDIPAAKKVLAFPIDKKYITSDVTNNDSLCITSKSATYERMSSSKWVGREIVKSNFDEFFKKLHPCTFMHDPLTASTLVDDKIIKFETQKIVIDDLGFCRKDESGISASISVSADYSRFMNLFGKSLPF